MGEREVKEVFCVIIQNLLAKEIIKVLADDIQVSEDGVRLYDGERTVAHFSPDIYRGVYREPIMVNSKGEFINLNEHKQTEDSENE
jgi:hypothetical protein